jgi:YVTN family beta-propeller protein
MRPWFLRSHLRGLFAAVLLILGSAAPAAAQNFVYAVDSGVWPPVMCFSFPGTCHAPTIRLINAATGHHLWTIVLPASGPATSLRLSADGNTVFVTASGTSGGSLFVVDALARRIAGQVDVGGVPVDVAVLPDNSRAYVVNSASDSVAVVDLASLAVVATIPVQSAPARIVVSPTGNALYVANSGSSSVSKISTLTNAVEATIGVGPSPSGLDLSPDGSRLFVASSGNQTVTVIDANLDSVQRVLSVGSTSAAPFDVSAQSPTRIFVTLGLDNESGSAVQLLNTADGSVLGSTPIGRRGRLARDSSGTPTYVAEAAAVRRVANDATSTTRLATGIFWNGAAVLTDPCAFESTASATVFGPAGGSGTLTIPAPAGCGWTLDTSGAAGFTFSGPSSGTGPTTVTYTSGASSTAKLGTIAIGRQAITLEQTIPRMVIDFPRGDTPVLQQPFNVGGWAIDQNLGAPVTGPIFRARGIDFLHAWAYPSSGAPIFLGSVTPGFARPDVASYFGSNLTNCGFNFPVSRLASGTYTLVVFAHSEISNQFVAAAAVQVTVLRTPPLMVVDTPKPSSTISGAFDVGGWAIDPAAADFSGSGVDAVHVWAYPISGASPIFVGAATPTRRPDVSEFFHDPDFENSGFLLRGATLPAGVYDLVVFARSTVDGAFNNATVVRITVQ